MGKNYLYNLPDLLRAIQEKRTVYITEGEKDVETLGSIGLKGSTSAGSDWKEEYGPIFIGCEVVIFRDNDNAGFKYSQKVKYDIRPYAFSVKVVNPSNLDKGDVTDFLTKEGGTKESLFNLIEKTDTEYAGWVYHAKDGTPKVNIGLLAETVSKNMNYLICRKQGDEKDLLYIFNGKIYERTNKNGLKAMIGQYIPPKIKTDANLNSVLGMILADDSHCCNYLELNQNENLICLENGVLNTDTWVVEEFSPYVKNTILYQVKYFPDKAYEDYHLKWFPKYMKDLCSSADGTFNEEIYLLLQEVGGLFISNIPVRKVKKAVILFSSLGNTGKSILLQVLMSFLGIYAVKSLNLAELKPDNRFILGDLIDYRLIVCGDESNANIPDSSIFKRLTGGDPVKVEGKGKDGFTYVWNGGIMVACNGLPCFVDDKGGHLFERLLIIPLEHHIPKEERDVELLQKLLSEQEGIFHWFMDGLKRLQENGFRFTKCDEVDQIGEEYRKSVDNLYRFVQENYVITGQYQDRISKTAFDDKYTMWANQNEEVKKIAKRNIADRLKKMGIVSNIGDVAGQRAIAVYRGIKPKEAEFKELNVEEKQTSPF